MIPFDYCLFLLICRTYQITDYKVNKLYTVNRHWYGNFLNYLLLTWLSFNNFHWVIPEMVDILSICFYFIVVDVSFFVVHYICHLYLYKKIHIVHHSCKPLLTLCTRSSHAIDAAFENIVFIFPFFFFQFNGFIAYLCLITNAFWVSYLHTNFNSSKNENLVMRPLHHSIHHKYGKKSYNYALYFTFWDKMFGTYKDV